MQQPFRFFDYDWSGNGSLTLPANSQAYVSTGRFTIPVNPPNGTGPFGTNNRLFMLGPGSSNVSLSVLIPVGSAKGSYNFILSIATFTNSSAILETYSNGIRVILNVD